MCEYVRLRVNRSLLCQRCAPVITGWDSFLIILSNINPVGWRKTSCSLMDNVITARPPTPTLTPLPILLLSAPVLPFSHHPMDFYFPNFIALFSTILPQSLAVNTPIPFYHTVVASLPLLPTSKESCNLTFKCNNTKLQLPGVSGTRIRGRAISSRCYTPRTNTVLNKLSSKVHILITNTFIAVLVHICTVHQLQHASVSPLKMSCPWISPLAAADIDRDNIGG